MTDKLRGTVVPFDRRFIGEFIYQLGLRGKPQFGDCEWFISLRLAACREPCTSPLFAFAGEENSGGFSLALDLLRNSVAEPVRLYPAAGVNLSASVRSAPGLWWQARTREEREILHVY